MARAVGHAGQSRAAIRYRCLAVANSSRSRMPDYVTRLPKAEQHLKEWQAAIEALIMAATLSEAQRRCAHRHHRPDMLQSTNGIQ
jgi:hypothetical protein